MPDVYAKSEAAARPVEIHGAYAKSEAVARPSAGSTFIVAPFYDFIFFILSPLLALGLGILIAETRLFSQQVTVPIFDARGTVSGIFIGTFIMAHLFIVFFRSNGNQKIFQLYPVRFTGVPVALFLLMCGSRWLSVAMYVLAIWWDVYHSSLQTFGLGRIYDVRQGNSAQVGRRLDYLLNLLLYAGPILSGATLMMHTEEFREFERVGSTLFAHLGDAIDARQAILRAAILGLGIPFLFYYVLAYWRYGRQGYRVSLQKVVLLLSTAACSIYTWGFNSFGEAFFIMNFFHAFQYFGLVWWSERKSMTSLFRLSGVRGGGALTLILFLLIAFGYGLWAHATDAEKFGGNIDIAFNVVTVVSLMHFWYDGFIWSVRKSQV